MLQVPPRAGLVALLPPEAGGREVGIIFEKVFSPRPQEQQQQKLGAGGEQEVKEERGYSRILDLPMQLGTSCRDSGAREAS